MSRRRLIIAVLALLLAAWVAATVALIFLPDEHTPARAGAVVVLSGSKGERLDRALTLMRGRVAPVLVISGGLDPRQPKANRLCRAGRGEGFRVVCFEPRPDSTRGEAETVGRLAARNHWRSIVIVTSHFHVTRATMLFRRCFDGRIDAAGVSYPWWNVPIVVAGEWAKLAHALVFAREC